MPTCVPIRDMKDTAKFSALVESSEGPITVTKNGYETFVVMKAGDYAELQKQAAMAKLMSRIALAEKELAEGRYSDGFEFLSEMKARYGL